MALLNEILIHAMNKFELIDGMMTIVGVAFDETIKILMAKTHKIDSLFSHLPSHAYLRVLIYKQPDIETQIFCAHFWFCCPIPTTSHGGQS